MFVMLAASTSGCTTSECDCSADVIVLNSTAPEPKVTNADVTGPACSPATIDCTTSGCSVTVPLVAKGTCHIDLTSETGKHFIQDLTTHFESGGCCPDYWVPNINGYVEVKF